MTNPKKPITTVKSAGLGGSASHHSPTPGGIGWKPSHQGVCNSCGWPGGDHRPTCPQGVPTPRSSKPNTYEGPPLTLCSEDDAAHTHSAACYEYHGEEAPLLVCGYGTAKQQAEAFAKLAPKPEEQKTPGQEWADHMERANPGWLAEWRAANRPVPPARAPEIKCARFGCTETTSTTQEGRPSHLGWVHNAVVGWICEACDRVHGEAIYREASEERGKAWALANYGPASAESLQLEAQEKEIAALKGEVAEEAQKNAELVKERDALEVLCASEQEKLLELRETTASQATTIEGLTQSLELVAKGSAKIPGEGKAFFMVDKAVVESWREKLRMMFMWVSSRIVLHEGEPLNQHPWRHINVDIQSLFDALPGEDGGQNG